jgi:signal peptidase II
MIPSAEKRIGAIGLTVFAADQASKLIVRRLFSGNDERVVIDGFFKFVHWKNTGAAWSFFHNHNGELAVVSICAFALLIYFRRHFGSQSPIGQAALGLIMGGILGNLVDRLFTGYVVDFLRFYLYQRSGAEIGFPAFNIADSAICAGVGLLVLLPARESAVPAPVPAPAPSPAAAAQRKATTP